MFRYLTRLKQNQKIIISNIVLKNKTLCTMSDLKRNDTGIPLNQVVDALQKFADLSLADSWDNVGLLIEPTEEKLVSHILLTIDLTEDVMREALTLKTDMIITYHPLIFAPMKSVTTRSWKERIVAKCLENKVAVYSPHTTLDSVTGGVNDWLASLFEDVLASKKPIRANEDNADYGYGRMCNFLKAISIQDVVQRVKDRTRLNYVRLARARGRDDLINSVALCAGSGTSILKGVKADLYLTGEMSHHDVLDAVHNGTSVILTNHSDSERGFLYNYASTLRYILDKSVMVNISKIDSDPLKTV